MIRTTQEWRRQIGMMLAICIRYRTLFWSILLEGAVTSALGAATGIMLSGIAGVMMLKAFLLQEAIRPQISIPYMKLVIVFAITLCVSMLFLLAPARRTRRIPPSEATR
jgi:ABC-type antimicrobial peptide transport system permease subunit